MKKSNGSKLYFYYGTMGSAKTANALMQKYNLNEKGYRVLLLKPALDTRDGKTIIKSRVGLKSKAFVFTPTDDLTVMIKNKRFDCLIVDECQFATAEQVEQLRMICYNKHINIYCYGLLADFTTHLFEGSKRLVEIADKLILLENYCECGNKANVNARFDGDGNVLSEGEQVKVGGNEMYKALCYSCWKKKISK